MKNFSLQARIISGFLFVGLLVLGLPDPCRNKALEQLDDAAQGLQSVVSQFKVQSQYT